MREISHIDSRSERRYLNDDLVEDLIRSVSILHRAGIIALIGLAQGLNAERPVGKYLVFGVISDGPHAMLPEDAWPRFTNMQAVEDEIGLPWHGQDFSKGYNSCAN